MKIVINCCHGGFSLSRAALDWLVKRKHPEAMAELAEFNPDSKWADLTGECWLREIARNDPLLIKCVKALGSAASGRFAELEIVEVSDDRNWQVNEYDGYESIDLRDSNGVRLLPC